MDNTPQPLYIVDDNFSDFDILRGTFIIEGSHYADMLMNALRWPDRIRGIICRSESSAVKHLPPCHLYLDLDKDNYEGYLRELYRFHPQKVSFRIWRDKTVLDPALKYLYPFKYELDVAGIVDILSRDELEGLIDTFFHREGLLLSIQPLSQMVKAFLYSQEFDLWRVMMFRPEEVMSIVDGSVGYCGAGNGLRKLGEYRNGKISYTDEHEIFVAGLNDFQSSPDCTLCDYYFSCKGAPSHLFGRCDNWRLLFERVHQETGQLRAHFSRQQPAP